MGVEWASRSAAQWMVLWSSSHPQGTPQEREEAEKLRLYSSRLIVGDLEKWKPHTVAVKTGPIRQWARRSIGLPFSVRTKSLLVCGRAIALRGAQENGIYTDAA